MNSYIKKIINNRPTIVYILYLFYYLNKQKIVNMVPTNVKTKFNFVKYLSIPIFFMIIYYYTKNIVKSIIITVIMFIIRMIIYRLQKNEQKQIYSKLKMSPQHNIPVKVIYK